MLNWIVLNRTDYLHKMDLALNNLQRLIYHKTQQTEWLVDFKDTSTHVELFCAKKIGNHFHCTFVFPFLCSCFLRVSFCTQSYQMWMIFKQTHRWDSIRDYDSASVIVLKGHSTLARTPKLGFLQMWENFIPEVPFWVWVLLLFSTVETACSKSYQQVYQSIKKYPS